MKMVLNRIEEPVKIKTAILGLLLLCPATSKPIESFTKDIIQSLALGFAMGFTTEQYLTNPRMSNGFKWYRDVVFEVGTTSIAIHQSSQDIDNIFDTVALAVATVFGYVTGSILAECLN
jgi:hypothetical protein